MLVSSEGSTDIVASAHDIPFPCLLWHDRWCLSRHHGRRCSTVSAAFRAACATQSLCCRRRSTTPRCSLPAPSTAPDGLCSGLFSALLCSALPTSTLRPASKAGRPWLFAGTTQRPSGAGQQQLGAVRQESKARATAHFRRNGDQPSLHAHASLVLTSSPCS
jgi:hypothetical protein